MALSILTTWEVRASGAGVSDNNGGGYVPGSSGTDFSQQNSPQYALTGLASAGAGNVVLSAAAAADMVGNIAQVISGTNYTAGFYQVASVVVGVSITFSTNNSGGSICSGVGASGVLNIGGALLTLAKVQTAVFTGNTVYCVGTFPLTSSLAIATVEASSGPLVYIGYTTTRTDNGQCTWTSSTNNVSIVNASSCDCVSFFNITMSSTAGTPKHGLECPSADGGRIRFVNCVLTGFIIGINGKRTVNFGIDGLFVEKTEIKSCSQEGINNTYNTCVFGSFIHGNTGSGYKADTNRTWSFFAYHSVFYSNGASGIDLVTSALDSLSQHAEIVNCVCSTNTGAGIIQDTSGSITGFFANNIFDRNTTYGVDLGTVSARNMLTQYNNAFYNNTTAARRTPSDIAAAIGDITLSADPYTSVGTNFALNSTAGGGAACNGAGAPGTIPNAGSGTANVGALDPSSGGGGTTVIVIGRNVTTFLGEQGDLA